MTVVTDILRNIDSFISGSGLEIDSQYHTLPVYLAINNNKRALFVQGTDSEYVVNEVQRISVLFTHSMIQGTIPRVSMKTILEDFKMTRNDFSFFLICQS